MRWLCVIFCVSACSPVIDYGGVIKDAGSTIVNVARDTSDSISNMFGGGSDVKKMAAKQVLASHMSGMPQVDRPNMPQASGESRPQTVPTQQAHAHNPNYRPPSTIRHRMPSPLKAYERKPLDRTARSRTSASSGANNRSATISKPGQSKLSVTSIAAVKQPPNTLKAIPPTDVQRSQPHLIYRPAVTPYH